MPQDTNGVPSCHNEQGEEFVGQLPETFNESDLAQLAVDRELTSFDTRFGPLYVLPGSARKVARVMLEIEDLKKGGHNDFHNFKYLAADQILNYLRPLMAAHNLVIVPHILDIKQTATQTQITLAMIVIDADTGEAWSERWIGEATDKGDKGIAKAITIASKTYMMRLFNVQGVHDPDMKDPDAESGVVEEGKITGQKSAASAKPPQVKTAAKSSAPAKNGAVAKPPQRPAAPAPPAAGWAMTKALSDELVVKFKTVYGEEGDAYKEQIGEWFAAHQLGRWGELTEPLYKQMLADLATARAQDGATELPGEEIPFGGESSDQ